MSKLSGTVVEAAATLGYPLALLVKECRGRRCKATGPFTATGAHLGYCDTCVALKHAQNAARQTTHKVQEKAKTVKGVPAVQLMTNAYSTDDYIRRDTRGAVVEQGALGYLRDVTALNDYICSHNFDRIDSNGLAPEGDSFNGIDKINGEWRELRTTFCMGSNRVLEVTAPAEVSTHG